MWRIYSEQYQILSELARFYRKARSENRGLPLTFTVTLALPVIYQKYPGLIFWQTWYWNSHITWLYEYTAARLITNTRTCEHITPVLQQLHGLPVRQLVQFKIAVLVYKALHDLLSAYLADCQLVSVTERRQLRSSDINTCHTSWWLFIRCCWTSRMKQSANPAARVSLHSDNFNEHSKRIYFVTDSCSDKWVFFVHCV